MDQFHNQRKEIVINGEDDAYFHFFFIQTWFFKSPGLITNQK